MDRLMARMNWWRVEKDRKDKDKSGRTRYPLEFEKGGVGRRPSF